MSIQCDYDDEMNEFIALDDYGLEHFGADEQTAISRAADANRIHASHAAKNPLENSDAEKLAHAESDVEQLLLIKAELEKQRDDARRDWRCAIDRETTGVEIKIAGRAEMKAAIEAMLEFLQDCAVVPISRIDHYNQIIMALQFSIRNRWYSQPAPSQPVTGEAAMSNVKFAAPDPASADIADEVIGNEEEDALNEAAA